MRQAGRAGPLREAYQQATRYLTSVPGRPVGFVTGGQMDNFTALAAARHFVPHAAGRDVEARGQAGATTVHALAGAERHHTGAPCPAAPSDSPAFQIPDQSDA